MLGVCSTILAADVTQVKTIQQFLWVVFRPPVKLVNKPCYMSWQQWPIAMPLVCNAYWPITAHCRKYWRILRWDELYLRNKIRSRKISGLSYWTSGMTDFYQLICKNSRFLSAAKSCPMLSLLTLLWQTLLIPVVKFCELSYVMFPRLTLHRGISRLKLVNLLLVKVGCMLLLGLLLYAGLCRSVTVWTAFSSFIVVTVFWVLCYVMA